MTARAAVANLGAAAAALAAISKQFLPFWHVGSTPILVAALLVAAAAAAARAGDLVRLAAAVPVFVAANAALYAWTAANYLASAPAAVPPTHLAGLLGLHGAFLVAGFAAALAPRAALGVLAAAAAAYVGVLAAHLAVHGRLMDGPVLRDVFALGVPGIVTTVHQSIGLVVGLGALSVLGIAGRRAAAAAALVAGAACWAVAARSGLFALAAACVPLAAAALPGRSPRTTAAVLAASALAVAAAVAVLVAAAGDPQSFPAVGSDPVSRTIRELRTADSELRLGIWSLLATGLLADPASLLVGHGLGSVPLARGYGPPDWLLSPTVGTLAHAHNVYLDALYELGLAGLLPLLVATLGPALAVAAAPRRSRTDEAAVAVHLFLLATALVSGSFAFTYMLQFSSALVAGAAAQLRRGLGSSSRSFAA
jgi:O-antigen ligase